VNQSQKPIRKTALGSWLKGKAPHLLDAVGDLLPDQGGLGVLKRVLDQDDQITAEDREHIQMMIDQRNELEAEITSRWQADSSSSSWLASNVRPMIVLVLVCTLLIFIVLDSMQLAFTIRDAWISLYEVLTLTAVGGYFTLRSVVDKRLKP
jgi:hypothetical protein